MIETSLRKTRSELSRNSVHKWDRVAARGRKKNGVIRKRHKKIIIKYYKYEKILKRII